MVELTNFKSILNHWFNQVIRVQIPIFDLNDDRSIKTEIQKNKTVLKVTDIFKNYFETKVEEMNKESDTQGFIYLMYRFDTNGITPLYIGRSGKTKGRIKPFQRWLNNVNSDHIFILSNVIIEGKMKPKKYLEWKNSLFHESKLVEDVYFTIIPWTKNSTVPITNVPIPLKMAEFLLIGVIGEVYPEHFLNFEGRSREPVIPSEIYQFTTFENLDELWL